MAALSWNEIRDRALKFSREWATAAREDSEAKSFWDAFFEVFGKARRTVAAAYGWPSDLTNDHILEKLLALNLDRAGSAPKPEPAP